MVDRQNAADELGRSERCTPGESTPRCPRFVLASIHIQGVCSMVPVGNMGVDGGVAARELDVNAIQRFRVSPQSLAR